MAVTTRSRFRTVYQPRKGITQQVSAAPRSCSKVLTSHSSTLKELPSKDYTKEVNGGFKPLTIIGRTTAGQYLLEITLSKELEQVLEIGNDHGMRTSNQFETTLLNQAFNVVL
jgi:hypothetical protein